MAVRSPSGKTFPGNFTIIPSAKKWVFHAIYRLSFLSLYGEHICLLNRLDIMDEEDAEYRSFETLILTHEMFRSSTVMLCTFHAIWQPFKRDICWLPYPQKYITGNTPYGTGNATHTGNVRCPYWYCTPLYFTSFLANALRYVLIQSLSRYKMSVLVW
jgi:hypothetical protein